MPLKPRQRISRKLIESELKRRLLGDIRRICFCTESASRCGAAVASNNRITPAALRRLDGRTRGVTMVQWERRRQLHLPTLEGLTPREVLALRHEAKSALPAFRQRVSEALRAETGDADAAAMQLASELRSEAASLEAELKGVNISGVRRGGTLLASSGVALTFFGLMNAPAIAATGMVALMTAASHALEQRRKAEGELAKLQTKPAYVTLVAQRLKQHSHAE